LAHSRSTKETAMYNVVFAVFFPLFPRTRGATGPCIPQPDVSSRIDTKGCHQQTGLWMFTLGAHKDTSTYNVAAVWHLL